MENVCVDTMVSVGGEHVGAMVSLGGRECGCRCNGELERGPMERENHFFGMGWVRESLEREKRLFEKVEFFYFFDLFCARFGLFKVKKCTFDHKIGLGGLLEQKI